MKFICLFLILLISCGRAPEKKLELRLSSIIGGDKIAENSKVKKYVVGVFDPNFKYVCTGTLISAHTVLTAGHCAMHAKDKKLEIIFDDTIYTNQKNKIPVDTINIHPNFLINEKVIANDLALLTFKNPLPDNYDFIDIDHIESLSNEFQSDVIIAGMGHSVTWPFQMGAGTLRESLLTNQNIDLEKEIIVLDQSKKTGICQGDSGSGIFVEKDQQLYIIGVTSYVDLKADKKTADCKNHSYFSSIKFFKEWIDANIIN